MANTHKTYPATSLDSAYYAPACITFGEKTVQRCA